MLKNVTVKHFASCARIWALSNRICCRLVLRNGTEAAKLRRFYYCSALYIKVLYVIGQWSLKEAQQLRKWGLARFQHFGSRYYKQLPNVCITYILRRQTLPSKKFREKRNTSGLPDESLYEQKGLEKLKKKLSHNVVTQFKRYFNVIRHFSKRLHYIQLKQAPFEQTSRKYNLL